MRPYDRGAVCGWQAPRFPLREPTRGQDAPGFEEGTEDKGAAGRKREHDGAVPLRCVKRRR
jgi:hypothetical protein